MKLKFNPDTTGLKCLSNSELHEKLRALSSEERRLTLEVLKHLQEVEARKLFCEMGYASLFDYVVQELKYSESTAQRRIASMRALREVPEIEEKLQTGELKITQVAQVQTFFRAEKKEGKIYSKEQKRELFAATFGKSTRETEKLLLEKSPSYVLHSGALRDRVREVTPMHTQVTFTADESLMKQLGEIRDRFAQQLPVGATPGEVIRFMADFVLKNDPMLRRTRIEKAKQAKEAQETKKETSEVAESSRGVQRRAAQSVSAPQVTTRYIPRPIQRMVWRRDYAGGCAMVRDGKRCGSKHRLQIDHIRPFALGGSSTDSQNLRLACFHHNQLSALKTFGGP